MSEFCMSEMDLLFEVGITTAGPIWGVGNKG